MIEQRNRSTYYYRSRRVNGRVVREYVGGGRGLMGELAREFDEDDRFESEYRRAAAERARAERARRAAEARSELARVDRMVRPGLEAARGLLEALGCRKHGGQWRRRRGAVMGELATLAGDLGGLAVRATPGALPSWESGVCQSAHWLIERCPWGIESNAAYIENQVLEHARELAGDVTTGAEWGLCVTAAFVWLELRVHEANEWSEVRDKRAAETAEQHQRHIDRLRRRYSEVVKTLGVVRRLAAPVMKLQQTNIQINNGGGAA